MKARIAVFTIARKFAVKTKITVISFADKISLIAQLHINAGAGIPGIARSLAINIINAVHVAALLKPVTIITTITSLTIC